MDADSSTSAALVRIIAKDYPHGPPLAIGFAAMLALMFLEQARVAADREAPFAVLVVALQVASVTPRPTRRVDRSAIIGAGLNAVHW